jgi:hypothetical protein
MAKHIAGFRLRETGFGIKELGRHRLQNVKHAKPALFWHGNGKFLIGSKQPSMKRTVMVVAMLLVTSSVLLAQPPHAKAYGKRNHHQEYKGKYSKQFHYYPQYNMYYHPAGKKYACYQRGQWVWVTTPPPGLVLRGSDRREFYYDGFDVWAYEPVRRYPRPSVHIQVNL